METNEGANPVAHRCAQVREVKVFHYRLNPRHQREVRPSARRPPFRVHQAWHARQVKRQDGTGESDEVIPERGAAALPSRSAY